MFFLSPITKNYASHMAHVFSVSRYFSCLYFDKSAKYITTGCVDNMNVFKIENNIIIFQ